MTSYPPPFSDNDARPEHGAPRIALRLLTTGDLHLTLTARDPLDGRRGAEAPGLARLATLIARARAECANTLLLDAGDFLQGPLGEALGPDIVQRGLHPMITAMNLLGYDAATLGNHDFDHGLSHLRQSIQNAHFPVVCANLAGLPWPVRPAIMLRRHMRDTAGRPRLVRIGITGAAPPRSLRWSRIEGLHPAPKAPSDGATDPQAAALGTDIVQAIASQAATLRASGAHLVIALVHSGLGTLSPGPEAENAARAVAALPGVDAVIAGHSHEVFPAAPMVWPSDAEAASNGGAETGAPLVLAGARGSHLGVVDLELRALPTGGHSPRPLRAEVIEAATAMPRGSDRRIGALAQPAIRRAQRAAARTIGHAGMRLASHFAAITPDPAARLLAEAHGAALRATLTQWADPALADLPVLGVAPPFGAPLGGPTLDLAAGPLRRGDLHRICPFADVLVAVVTDGRGLRSWLEQAASVYCHIQPGLDDQPLLRPEVPLYTFDLIEGLSYTIDPAAPIGCRIGGLQHAGHPIAPDDRFILATNSYRAGGGGGFEAALGGAETHATDVPVRQALEAYLAARKPWRPQSDPPWRLAPVAGASALIETEAAAAALLRSGMGPPGLGLVRTLPGGRVLLRMQLAPAGSCGNRAKALGRG